MPGSFLYEKKSAFRAHRNFYFVVFLLSFVLLTSCRDNTYRGVCTLQGNIRNYRNIPLALYEITPSQNYLVSKVEADRSGKFEFEFKAAEKSLYGLTDGRAFIYFINDVPLVSVETSQDEFANYQVQDSPESEELRQLVVKHKKLATEVTLAERLLVTKMTKMSGKFGNDPEMLDLENKADKRSLELRNYIVNFMDTVHDKLLAVAASSLLSMQEDFNYLDLFCGKLQQANVNPKQKADLKVELEKTRRSFQSIAPLSQVRGTDLQGTVRTVDSLRGKYVFINIWATWCYSSRAELSLIKQAQEKLLTGRNVTFINVAIDEDVPAWKKFLAQEKYEMPYQLCDSLGKNAAILKRFGLEYIPANFLLDTNGSILTSNLKGADILPTIESVLRNKTAVEKK